MVFLSRFYLTLATATLLAMISVWIPEALSCSFFLTAFLLTATVFDLLFTPPRALRAVRTVPSPAAQAKPFTIELVLANLLTRPALFRLRDSAPAAFHLTQPGDFLVRLLPLEKKLHSYEVRTFQRGLFTFGPLFYRVQGPFGLVQRQDLILLPQDVQVLPDITAESDPDLRLHLAGAFPTGRRRAPRRGEGREFESLREYRRDDDFRLIDWKASAKRGKWICRQYEIERDQRLMILLDTGRLMSPKIGSYRKLDYAVNACLHLAQVAFSQGDQVGFSFFNDELTYFAEPKRSTLQMTHLLEQLAMVQPSRLESDYQAVLHEVVKRCSRRMLVVCLTDLTDAYSARSLLNGCRLLRPRHLPVVVTISNSQVLGLMKRPVKTEDDVYMNIAASEIWDEYQKTSRSFHSYGIASVSVPAQKLSLATINEYLKIKESARL